MICRHCGRWNLVPFDTRLETIDRCEQLFRDTRMRFSTDNVGLARLHEGLELVRIGEALRPEFAAWRYGDRFASRRRRNILVGGTLGVAAVGLAIGAQAMLGGMTGFQFVIQGFSHVYERRRIATRVIRGDRRPALTLSRYDVKAAKLLRLEDGSGYGVSVPERVGVIGGWCSAKRPHSTALLTGDDAVTALAQMLPVLAGTAGTRKHVSEAVRLVEVAPPLREALENPPGGRNLFPFDVGKLTKLSAQPRLALEMMANEQAEREWLAGELKLLERQWREAERLAAIADQLAVPAEVERELEERKGE